MTRRIAAETVNLTCLLKPGVDGHVYEVTPQDRKAIEDAQLIFYSGYNFEPDLIKLIQSTSNPATKVAVAEKAVPKPLMGEEHDHGHGGKEDDQGHDDPTHADENVADAEVPDPHVWQSAENGVQMAALIQQELARLSPAQATVYAQNAAALQAELQQIHTWIQTQIATIPPAARKLVTTHEAMAYYSTAYNIPVEGALQGISTEEKPTAARTKELVDEVETSQVPTIFAEVVVNPKLIQAIAREANVRVSERKLYSDSLGESGSEADTYAKMLIANTRTIVEGLGGQFTALQPQ
jgi:manganese/iron transport system substrate-binding protein